MTILTPINSNSSEFGELAKEVEQFSDIICGRIEVIGTTKNLEISGGAEAEAALKLLTKKLANIGFEGAVDFISNKYIGVLQQDLASDRSGVRDCRMKVWNDFRGFVSLANNSSISSDQNELQNNYNLPIDIRVAKKRSISILDGSVKLSLSRIQVSARKKRSTLRIDIPNRPPVNVVPTPLHAAAAKCWC